MTCVLDPPFHQAFQTPRNTSVFGTPDKTLALVVDILLENLWVETQDLIIGVLYKPPNLLNREFLDLIEETLYTIHLSKKKYLIMSDVNIITLKKSNTVKEYLNLVRSEGFNPF